MTKPRFTPDPLPDGLDPTLRAYLQRQFDRAADWWPKDLEARVAGLERTFKYIGGVWPIVDYSTVEFNGSATAGQVFAVNGFMYSNTGSNAKVTEGSYLDFDPVSETITGLTSSFNILIDNEQGQALALTFASADNSIYRTSDGLTWLSTNPSAIYGTRGVVWFNDRWIVVGGVTSPFNYGFACISSTDGVTWNALYSTTDRAFEPSTNNAICTNGTRLLCAGRNFLTGNRIAYSDDGGLTWAHYAVANDDPIRNAWYGNGLWFFTTLKRRLYTSPTGEEGTWTLRLNYGSIASEFRQLMYANGRYMLVSWDNNISTQDYLYTSTDGLSWATTLAIPDGTGPWSLSYDDTYGWFFGQESTAKWSTDGLTWYDTNLASIGFSIRGYLRMKIPL